MSEFARDVGLGASTGLAGVARGRRVPKVPVWLRLVVVLSIAIALWAVIIAALRMLLAG